MKAKKKPLDIMPIASLGVDLAPQVRTLRYEQPAQRQKGTVVPDVDALIAALREKGFFN